MSADPFMRLSDRAGEAYARFVDGGAPAAFEEARLLMAQAIGAARADAPDLVPKLLFNLSHIYYARFLRDHDREDLGEAYSLLVEAVAQAERDPEITNRYQAVSQVLGRSVDLDQVADAQWFLGLHRRLVTRAAQDSAIGWANLTLAAYRLWLLTGSTEDLRLVGYAGGRAGRLCPPGSPLGVQQWTFAAEALAYLAAHDRRPEEAREAVEAYAALAAARPDGAPERDGDAIRSRLAHVLAYELSGLPEDRDRALAALATLTAGTAGIPPVLQEHARDTLGSLYEVYRGTADESVHRAAVAFGVWCVARMDNEPMVDQPDLPGVLNALAVFLAEASPPARPLPWDPSTAPENATVRYHGLAAAFGRYPPFGPARAVETAPLGQVGVEAALPQPAALWHESRASPLRGHAISWFRRALALPPPDEYDPEPDIIPVRNHLITLTLTAPDRDTAIVDGVRIAIDDRFPVGHDKVDTVVIQDALPRPGFTVFLEFEPPLLWPRPAPLTIPPGQTRQFTVRAISEEHAVGWRLLLDWRCGRRRGTLEAPLRTTGQTGLRSAGPDGEVLDAPGYTLGT